jgi:hypothetical protein
MTQTIVAVSTVLLICKLCARAELTREQEALTIAQNYVSFILVNEGNWGGSDSAEVVSIQEFRRGDRTLGYFGRVEPQGFLVLSLHRELAPVRAYSNRSNLNPESEEGLTDLIKDKMESILDGVETRLGRPLGPEDEFGDLLDINYRAVSDALASEAFDPQVYREPQRISRSAGMNYQEGEWLLTSSWHQQPPYNDQCPSMDCPWPGYDGFNDCARVGCVATAGAQVMYHWRWPPAGADPFVDSYDWPNMCDAYVYDGAGWFNDENGLPVTWAQINAVAELSNEIGIAAYMDYGCSASGTPTAYLEDALETYFHYSIDGAVVYRSDYDNAIDWFNELKHQFNANRPMPYRIDEHAIVGDGWKEEWIEGDYYWYHMNYGWPNNDYDTWWPLDELHHGTPDEYAIANIVPNTAIGSTLAAFYPGGVRRYFDLDATGTNSWFSFGQDLQILRSGFLLVNSGGPTDAIRFNGEPGLTIRFFMEGDVAGKTRIRIQGGAMKLNGGAEMVIR